MFCSQSLAKSQFSVLTLPSHHTDSYLDDSVVHLTGNYIAQEPEHDHDHDDYDDLGESESTLPLLLIHLHSLIDSEFSDEDEDFEKLLAEESEARS